MAVTQPESKKTGSVTVAYANILNLKDIKG